MCIDKTFIRSYGIILVMKIIGSTILILFFSFQINSADKVLECKSFNENLESRCPGVEHTNIVKIILNTNDFAKSSASAELASMMCHKNYIADSKRVPMEVTPTTLTFIRNVGGYKSYWNVDRKTLKAGWDSDRTSTCTISDLDTSSNQI